MAVFKSEQDGAIPVDDGGTVARRRRILFVAEAVTLAHVARPASLLRCLDREVFDAKFAADVRSRKFLSLEPDQFVPIESIDSAVFERRLRRGVPVYTRAELEGYVRADLALIEKTRPDVIVGDFRLSLSVSARLAGIPYACITNSYWSPFARELSFPIPVLPWTRFVPLHVTQRMFDKMHRHILAPHSRPLNQVRLAYGLPELGSGLRQVYTDADHVLYADSPDLFPLIDPPSNHLHLGPIPWSPPVELPVWWDDLPTDRPIVYVTMGSSGCAKDLDLVVASVAELPVNVIVATVGAPLQHGHLPNVWSADYLPGDLAAAKAAVVICNGGSPTSQQALAAGKPVIGICRNMDQMLNMRALVAASEQGVFGILLRCDRLKKQQLKDAVSATLLHVPASRRSLNQHSRAAFPDFATRFKQLLVRIDDARTGWTPLEQTSGRQ
ncbi:MAG: glycosyltransferase [Rubrivivax sp.]